MQGAGCRVQGAGCVRAIAPDALARVEHVGRDEGVGGAGVQAPRALSATRAGFLFFSIDGEWERGQNFAEEEACGKCDAANPTALN